MATIPTWKWPGIKTPRSGSFVSQQAIAYHTAPISVISADLDDDGDLDVLSASYGDDTIAWHESLPGPGPPGSIWSEHTISTVATGAWDVFAADLDNDGDLDVLVASNLGNDVAWYENRLDEVSNDFGPLSSFPMPRRRPGGAGGGYGPGWRHGCYLRFLV